ncbi:hypothetical protein Tco_1081451 [Tanacetum coccineum]|uniref:Uncharacterized protein n=1 Tax=Tanacetum coccineum TaxID=301880 RepID=A0ABQ5HYS3_9ASTR
MLRISCSHPPSLLASLSSPPQSLIPSLHHLERDLDWLSPPPPSTSSPPPQTPQPPHRFGICSEKDVLTLHARVESLEQHDVVTQGSLRIARDVETLHTRAEAIEQRAEALQASMGTAQMDVRDLIEFRGADRLEMAELRSRAQDKEASF